MKSSWFWALLVLLVAANASACNCVFSTVEAHVRHADTIYVATLRDARLVAGERGKEWPRVEGTFEVSEVLKGEAPPGQLVLSTPADFSACGIPMTVAARYIVFLDNGRRAVSSCDGSAPVERFPGDDFAARVRAQLKANEQPSKK